MDPLYREIILEHWENPQNFGVLSHPDISVEEVNPLCGDILQLTMNVTDGKIVDILFSGESCAISRASASLFTEEIKRKSVASLKKIQESDVLALLGIELTPARAKCALLIFNTMKKALV